MKPFENINDQIVYTKVKLKTEALSMRDRAKEISQQGKNVVIFFNKRYHLYLAPGHDPYQIRKDIDVFLNPAKDMSKSSSESKSETENNPKNTPVRDSGGKFVSKKKDVLEPDSPTEKSPKKKNFWNSLK